MKPTFSTRYEAGLRDYLNTNKVSGFIGADKVAELAGSERVSLLVLAKLHEETLLKHVLPALKPSQRTKTLKKASNFFGLVVMPMVTDQSAGKIAGGQLKKFVEVLGQRMVELASSNLELSAEIELRKSVEEALKKSEHHFSQLLTQSDRMQEQLRQLSRQILTAQEEERKRISRELHDVIAQTLTSINVRLATLKQEASINTKGLVRNIDITQRLVEKSVNIVHQFARELRPAVLDDLGLIPAILSFTKELAHRTGLHIRLNAFAGVEKLDPAQKTVLYRVAQEAVTNVDRHAKATHVVMVIRKAGNGVSMRITDDGRSFDVDQAFRSKRCRHLGVLGMRERLEMMGGKFTLVSAQGKGTSVEAYLPFNDGRRSLKSTKSVSQTIP